MILTFIFFFFQAEDGIRDLIVTGVQTCALPIYPDLKPEVSTEWEVGTEIGGFRDRAAIDVTYYRRTTRDALYPRQYAPSGGFINLQLTNIGEIKSGGYDITANVLPINRANLSVKLFA